MATATQLTAADVMTASPRTCSLFSTVLEAVMIFRDADCGAVPVVQDGKPVGVLTDRDVALALAEYPDLVSRAVGDFMSEDLVTIGPDASLGEIETKIARNAVRRLLVVDSSGNLVGILAWADLARAISDSKLGEGAAEILVTT